MHCSPPPGGLCTFLTKPRDDPRVPPCPSPWGTVGSWLSKESPWGRGVPGWGREKDCRSRHAQGVTGLLPSRHRPQPHTHRTHSLTQRQAWEALECPLSQSSPVFLPKGWDPGALTPCFLGPWGDPPKCPKGCQEGTGGRVARDRTASQLLWDQVTVTCFLR